MTSNPLEADTENKYKKSNRYDLESELQRGQVKDVGQDAVWSLSSCKANFGIQQLLDESTETYWQSDGAQPHTINIQFKRKTTVVAVVLYIILSQDESYTPQKISIRIGTHHNDLREVQKVTLRTPKGWVKIPLLQDGKPIRTWMLQIAILGNHQNGRDSHVRRCAVLSPLDYETKKDSVVDVKTPLGMLNKEAYIR